MIKYFLFVFVMAVSELYTKPAMGKQLCLY